jgi:hypothetical protein
MAACALAYAVTALLVKSSFGMQGTSQHMIRSQSSTTNVATTTANHDTLIFYIFSDTDPAYVENLRFFVEHGTKSNHADYVVVVQDQAATSDALKNKIGRILKNLPAGSIVLHHVNDCYDLGTFGWSLKQPSIASKLSSYKYFIMVNSSVRGPFVPPYMPDRHEWYRLLTRRLGGTTNVRLVGATISCEGMQSTVLNAYLSSPHVQTWLFAVDREGLQILTTAETPLQCHADREDAIINGELGASMAILDAGYNIDCLLEPYQGIDWRNWRNHKCNDMRNPMKHGNFMGTTLHPYVTIFTKYKQNQVVEERSGAIYDAYCLSAWMKDSNTPRVLKRSDV